ncbi:hypothetical protein GRI40_09830 [Altererythrobacter aerius]|uniref:Uncharacterized protein n=1 Tax=Tsuneonella aeria TaxID=1837929 RepID=A0A6I4TFR3_9SPHN|nr:hypothetical protein [Tsuneonella aeria]MXO75514.1 hypothetical protein [Tsuneonella aeria]
MFERPIINSVAAASGCHEPEAGALRALDWHELVARLSAQRDMRALFARPCAAGGSFAPGAAAGIATHADHRDGCQRPVNFAALSSPEWPAAMPVAGGADRVERDVQ